MLDEYALVPDVFIPAAYTKPDYADMRLEDIKEPLLREALVRDLCNGEWSRRCIAGQDGMHRLTKELLRKLTSRNRLCRCPQYGEQMPNEAVEWCQQALLSHGARPLTGVIAANATKQQFSKEQIVCSIEKLTGTQWFQDRSSSKTIDRKTQAYLELLDRILRQANSLMFIDPYLNPQQQSYREFHELLAPMSTRDPQPRIELHRSFVDASGQQQRFLNEATGRQLFAPLDAELRRIRLSAEIYFWDNFHDRYLITDVIGVTVGAGFDVTTTPDDTTTWARLGAQDRDDLQRKYDPASRGTSLKSRFQIGMI